jgi:hypothetical protein
MGVMHPDYRSAAGSRRLDDLELRADKSLIAWKNHKAAGLAEFVDHVDYDDCRPFGVEMHCLDMAMSGKYIFGHGRPRSSIV